MQQLATRGVVSRRVTRHLKLKASGVDSFAIRQRIIEHEEHLSERRQQLEEIRERDFDLWMRTRRGTDIFLLIEIDGEQMIDRLTQGRGAFTRREILRCSIAQIAESVRTRSCADASILKADMTSAGTNERSLSV